MAVKLAFVAFGIAVPFINQAYVAFIAVVAPVKTTELPGQSAVEPDAVMVGTAVAPLFTTVLVKESLVAKRSPVMLVRAVIL